MARRSNCVWNAEQFLSGIVSMTDRKVAATYALLNGGESSRIERMAKQNAPWRDRTGHARQGLHAEAFKTRDMLGIRLAHSKSYGYHLEFARSGKYAIIRPTLTRESPAVFRAVRNLWG